MKIKRRRINGINIGYILNLSNIADNSSNSRLQKEVAAKRTKKNLKIKGGVYRMLFLTFFVFGAAIVAIIVETKSVCKGASLLTKLLVAAIVVLYAGVFLYEAIMLLK